MGAEVIGRSYACPVVLTPSNGVTYMGTDGLSAGSLFKRVYGEACGFQKIDPKKLKRMNAQKLREALDLAYREIDVLTEAKKTTAEWHTRDRAEASAKYAALMDVIKNIAANRND